MRCVAANDLRAAAGTTPPAVLEVPPWAMDSVTRMGSDHRRIEGLIAPGTFNVNPAASPQKILTSLISASAAEYAKSGLADTAKAMNLSPHDVLVVASLVQREATPPDFPKVARVIYNRLAEHRTLEFRLDGELPAGPAGSGDHRRRPGGATAWNTYVSEGLPETAICSPGIDALKARASRARRLAVLRHDRCPRHDTVHPRLPAAPGEYRAGQAQRCPRLRPMSVAARSAAAKRAIRQGPMSVAGAKRGRRKGQSGRAR
ncbi:endolytic transglycosylase MltG [Mycolicibacterium vaccae]|nr:endolytic transglycosylase MltG [Mycolicibacterium vaccae]